jgi:hypothetical protein
LKWAIGIFEDLEASKPISRANGHLHLRRSTALEREIAEPVGPLVHNDQVNAT